MSFLVFLLSVKILVTLVTVCLPFLFWKPEKLDQLTEVQSGSPRLYRLYGMAVLALLVGYGSGLVEALGGSFPTGIVLMGIVSNAGASFLLFFQGGVKVAPILTGLFTGIAVALVACLALPDLALTPLF